MSSDSSSKQPNFLLIVADDLGFSDTTPYGSEIPTPNLSWLAQNGIRMTDFHTAPTCSPTRSMLLSGTDNHIAGLGTMWEQIRFTPEVYKDRRGYEGYLNWDVAALPEVLQEAGYFTVISGKWHLGMTKDVAPCSRGFDKSFTYLAAAGSHWNNEPQLEEGTIKLPVLCTDNLWMEGDRFLQRKKELPKDFYSTKTFADKMISYLTDRTDVEKQKPFFAYLPFTAPHWPLQAPQDAIAKHRGVYDGGPDTLRWQRLAALQKQGLIPEGVEPAPITTMGTREWEELSTEEKRKSSRAMEIFAAMVELIDTHVGRVLDYLRSTDELDNTFVIFISDNGAEGHILEAHPVYSGASMADLIARHYNNSIDNMGNADSCVWYGPRWASAATAPSRGFKHRTSEGGIRCPCIVRCPPALLDGSQLNSISHSFTTVMDIMPTMLDFAGVSHPGKRFQNRDVVPMRGRSWRPILTNKDAEVYSKEFDFTGWEFFGSRAVRKGKWKALYLAPPKGKGDWELYNLDEDPGEIHDMATKEPDVMKDMIAHYELYYDEVGMFDASLAFQEAEKRMKSLNRGSKQAQAFY